MLYVDILVCNFFISNVEVVVIWGNVYVGVLLFWDSGNGLMLIVECGDFRINGVLMV